MTHPEDEKATLAALRVVPTEVSLEQVHSMVVTFPLAVGAMAWLISAIKFNLNTILMTSSASLIIGTSAYLIATSAPTELPAAATSAPAVVVEMAAEPLPEPEPAVVFELPATKKETPRPEPKEQEPSMACMVLSEDSVPTPLPAEEPDEHVLASVSVQPLPPMAPLAPKVVHKTTGERTFQLRDFIGIKVVSSMDVTLEIGDFAVTATGEEDALNQLDVQVKERALYLDYLIVGRSRRACGPVHFTVRMPLVHMLDVMGSGTIHAAELPSTARLDLGVMGSGNITLGSVPDATALNALVRGSGSIHLDELGTTHTADFNVVGSGGVDVSRIAQAGALQVLVAGSGVAACKQVKVTGTTTMAVTGSGELTVTGHTDQVNVTVTGSGNVHANDLKSNGGKVAITGSGDASVNSEGPLQLTTTGSGTIHTSGSAGKNRSRGVGDDGH